MKYIFLSLMIVSFLGGQVTTGFEKSSQINLAEEYKILFVGNSLTYINNLPLLVKKAAKTKRIEIKTKMMAFPNYALEDHLADGKIQKLINSGKYDFVIIQQGPSSQSDGKASLIEFGGILKNLCDENNAKLVYFMVWPSSSYYLTFDGVINNYKQAAEINKAIICPVGEVWKDHFDKTSNFDYYGPDGFHPSILGSKVAADIIVNTLF